MKLFFKENPFASRRMTAWEQILLSAYWFGANFVWGAFLGPVIASQTIRLDPQNSAGTTGIIVAIGAIPATLIPLIAGPLSDRCGSRLGRRRPYILGGGLFSVLGFALMAMAFEMRSLPGYIGAYLLIQLGTNTALAAYSAIIPDLVPEDQRGTASGYYAIMSQIATLAGAFICGKMVSANLHVQTFALVGGVYLLFVLIAMFATPEPQVRFEGPKLELVPYLKSLWIDPKTYPDFAWVWITRALMMLGFYLILPYLLFYLRDVVHLPDPASEVGTIMGIILLAAGISGFVGGVISDRFGRKRVVIASSLIVAATCLFFPFCSNQIQLLLTGLIFGIGYGTYISVDWALATDVLPSKEDAAKDMGIWHVSMTLPQNVAPLIGGAMILENFKAGTVMDQGEKVAVYGWTGYLILFIVSCVFFGLGGILIKKVKGST